jgi:CubicO group peptidase (beta-lactamase class C family)
VEVKPAGGFAGESLDPATSRFVWAAEQRALCLIRTSAGDSDMGCHDVSHTRSQSKRAGACAAPAARVLCGLLLAATGPGARAGDDLPRAQPEAVGMSSARLQRLSRRTQEVIDNGQVAGIVTLVARHGKVVHYEAQGYRNREEKVPLLKDDLFVIMSMTKPIASTALMMLHEEGKVRLTDPIARWLPEFAKMQVREPDGAGGTKLVPARPITVRHVLTHTAGLATRPAGGSASAPATTLRERVQRLAAAPLNFQPGDKWEYGSATDVVAALAEVISGQNMDDFLRERIFQPLGMHDTYYNVPESQWGRRAAVYVPQPDGSIQARPATKPRPTTVFGGVAGLTSTAADYFKFHQMLLNGGVYRGERLLGPKTIDLMISNHLGEGIPVTLKGPGYGFGLGYSILLDPGKASEVLSPGSFGWGGAWGTYFFVDPTEEVIGILMMQITSYNHLTIRQDLGTLAMQAIVEPGGSGAQKIRGYAPLR